MSWPAAWLRSSWLLGGCLCPGDTSGDHSSCFAGNKGWKGNDLGGRTCRFSESEQEIIDDAEGLQGPSRHTVSLHLHDSDSEEHSYWQRTENQPGPCRWRGCLSCSGSPPLKATGPNLPEFCRLPAWNLAVSGTARASWTALRHPPALAAASAWDRGHVLFGVRRAGLPRTGRCDGPSSCFSARD